MAKLAARGAHSKADGVKPGKLPISMAEFRRLVMAARTESQREQLWVRVCGEFPRYDAIVSAKRLPRAVQTPTGQLFEARLLEFVRTPKIDRQYGWDLALSHSHAWSDLADMRSRKFAVMLRRWLAGADRRLAAEAAKHLVQMGIEADLPRLLRALADGSWRVRGELGLGLTLVEFRHLTARFRERVFGAIVPLVCGDMAVPMTEEAEFALSNLTEAMVALNRKAALEVLTSNRALHPRNRAVGEVLRRLESEREHRPRQFRPVDPDLLWPVFEAVRDDRLRFRLSDGEVHWRAEQAMGDCLTLAADGDPIRTARECRALLGEKRPDGTPLKMAARAALKRCRNLPEPVAVLQAHWRKRVVFRGETLDVVQAYALLDHVLSDGLLAYFGNMGDDWVAAHRGLLALGQKSAAAIVAEGARIVMAFESPGARKSVRASAMEMDEAADRKLEALNDRFYKHIDRVLHAVERYIAEHPEAFRAVAPRARKGSPSA